MSSTPRWIEVCTLATGAPLRIAVWEIDGARDGPTLGVSALIHGDEITGPEVIRRLLDQIDPARVRGRLRLVPVANPLAFQTLTRGTPLAVEIANLNRVFPADASLDLPARLAHTLQVEFLDQITHLVDLHAGGSFPIVDYSISLRDVDMALAFGQRVVRPVSGYAGTMGALAASHGKPAVVAEIGGGYVRDGDYIALGVRGVLNVMRHLEMIEGRPERPAEQLVVTEVTTLRPGHGGLLYSEIDPQGMGREVAKGTVLGRVVWSGLNLPNVANEVAKFYMANNPGTTIEVLEGQNFEIYPKMVSARKLTPDRPLVHFGYSNTQFTYQGDIDDMWEALDLSNIPNAANVADAYKRPGNKGIGFSVAPVGLMYNPNIVREAPTSWTDMWSPRFRGKVTSIKYAWYTNGLVVAARLNGGSEKNIDPGFKLWSERANQYVAFANSNVEVRDLIVRGDAHIAAMFGGNALTWKQQGAPVEFVIPREGTIAFPLFLVVVKGVTPQQKRVAEGVINLILSDRWMARWASLTFFVPTSKRPVVPPSLRDLPMYSPRETERAIQFDWATIAQNETVWRERWDKEVVARMGR